MAVSSNSIPAPTDNLSPMDELLAGLDRVQRLASIAEGLLDRIFSTEFATDLSDDKYTVCVPSDLVSDLEFTAAEIKLHADRGWRIASPLVHAERSTDRPTVANGEGVNLFSDIGDVEGAVAMIAGLTEAIEVLASETANPARRLSGINAVVGPLKFEIENAKEGVRVLYDRNDELRRDRKKVA